MNARLAVKNVRMGNAKRLNLDCEILVIGGGPAGCSAAMTAHSLGIPVQIIEKHIIGGQVREIAKISNFVGGPSTGQELAEIFAAHMRACSIPIVQSEAVAVKELPSCCEVLCASGESLRTRAIIAATGTRELRLKEHPLVSNVDADHGDSFIYTTQFEQLMSRDVVIIGCDRVIVTLAASKGEMLGEARIHVLALPDKRYVIENLLGSLPFDFIWASRVTAVEKRSAADYLIEYLDDDGMRNVIRGEVLLTNLGKAPNSELFVDYLKLDSDRYILPETSRRSARPKFIYPVGDVAHKAFQRISTAIGDGAYAVLDYFYGRENLYQERSRSKR
jgi:thioredoxin reductase